MMEAVRNGAWAKSWRGTPDVQNYVGFGTSDIVAMWDGIRNSGENVPHDEFASVWKNISGISDYDLNVDFTTAEWVDDGLKRIATTTSDGIGLATGNVKLPEFSGYEFELVISYNNDFPDATTYVPFSGGGNVSGTKALRNIVYVQRFLSYQRLIYGSICSKKLNAYNSPTTDPFSAGVHYYSSGAERTRPMVDGIELSGSLAFEAYPINTNYNGNITLGGVKAYSRFFGEIGWSIKHCRVYRKHLTLEERIANYAIDKARFNLP